MSQYYYLVSSLPMLMLGAPSPMPVEQFISLCDDWVSKQEMDLIKNLSLVPEENSALKTEIIIEKWNEWETCLRNRIVRHRATGIGQDAEKYTRTEKDWFSEIENGVQEAFASPNPLAKEKILDRIRWNALDNFEAAHFFDFGRLCIYKLKLLLLEKWQEREQEKGKENLKQIIDKVYAKEKPPHEGSLVLSEKK